MDDWLRSVGVGQVANEEHLRILRQGVEVWNRWREENPEMVPDLNGADFGGANLREANLSKAELFEVNLSRAHLFEANLSEADLIGADLRKANLSSTYLRGAQLLEADLSRACLARSDLIDAFLSGAILRGSILSWATLFEADLSEADLIGADLRGANLSGADLSEADLGESNLSRSLFIETKIEGVKLTGSRVYGISAWGLKGIPKDQSNLIITRDDEPTITVDNLEVAQFIYLLLESPKIRDVIDTIAKKAVLILGSFNETQKQVLEVIRDELRKNGYLPILFDWDRPTSRNYLETVSTLAHLSRFVIADITDAKSIPAELMSIVPSLPSVTVQPLMLSSDYEYALFDHIMSFKSVLPVYIYDTPEMLLANLKEHVIDPAEAKARELIPPAANR